MFEPLTKRQKEILEFITHYVNINAYAPTLREIRDYFKLKSISTIHEHIENLRAKGYLMKSMNQARGLTNVMRQNLSEDSIRVPIIADLVYNKPLLPRTAKESFIIHRNKQNTSKNMYAIRVMDDIYNSACIMKDDLLIMAKDISVKNNDLILCTVGICKTVYLKKYHKEKYRIRLDSLRRSIKPRVCKNINILGILNCMYRSIN